MDEGILAAMAKVENLSRWREIGEEMKRLVCLAGPMVIVTLSFYLLEIISLMMVGRLGELALSGAAVAISLAGITGFSVLMGMASALETIGGQAFGAQHYKKLGTQTYTAIFSLVIVCIPISMLWINAENLLNFIGVDAQISEKSGEFAMWLLPALYGYATLQPLIHYYQVQSLTFPMVISSSFSLGFHIALCWALVFKSGWKSIGAAVAMDLSMWLNVVVLSLFMKYSPHCTKTRASISISKILGGIKEFSQFAIPSALMTCFEWWSFELLILLSGLLPNPKLETSVLSVCLNTVAMLNAIPVGLGAAASTRISNQLGAGRSEGARLSVIALLLLAATNALVVSLSFFPSRNVFGYIFSKEKEVVDYVTTMAPLVCTSIVIDCIQAVLSGVSRGCGSQHFSAYINLAAFYLFGIPIAAALAFWLDFRGKGLWIGVLCGGIMQSLLLAIVTAFINWEKQAAEAQDSLSEEKCLIGGEQEEE